MALAQKEKAGKAKEKAGKAKVETARAVALDLEDRAGRVEGHTSNVSAHMVDLIAKTSRSPKLGRHGGQGHFLVQRQPNGTRGCPNPRAARKAKARVRRAARAKAKDPLERFKINVGQLGAHHWGRSRKAGMNKEKAGAIMALLKKGTTNRWPFAS